MPVTTPWRPSTSIGLHPCSPAISHNCSSAAQHAAFTNNNDIRMGCTGGGGGSGALVNALVGYFATCPHLYVLTGTVLAAWYAENEQRLYPPPEEIFTAVCAGGPLSPTTTRPPRPRHHHDGNVRPPPSVPHVVVVSHASIPFDFVSMGCVSPAALEAFLRDPWAGFQRLCRAALTLWFTTKFVAHLINRGACQPKGADSDQLEHGPAIGDDLASLWMSEEELVPPQVTLWLMMEQQQHRGGVPLHLHVDDATVLFTPRSVPHVFLSDYIVPPPATQDATPLTEGEDRASFRGSCSAAPASFTVAFQSVVVGYTAPPASRCSSAQQRGLVHVELSRLRPVAHSHNDPLFTSSFHLHRRFFLDTTVVASIGHLPEEDQRCFLVGHTVHWLGRCSTTTQKVDVMCVLYRNQESESAALCHYVSPLPDDVLRYHGSEQVSIREAAACWRGLFDAWAVHAPCCPPGWISRTNHRAAEIPVLWAAVMLSASLPNCALQLGCVVAHPAQVNYLSSLMRHMEHSVGCNVHSIGPTNADRWLMPTTTISAPPSAASSHYTTNRAGTLSVCSSGAVAFVGDLERYSPSVLRMLRLNILRTSLHSLGAEQGKITAGVTPADVDPARLCSTRISSIAVVSGRSSAVRRETNIEEYLSDCDLLLGFPSPPPPTETCGEIAEILSRRPSSSTSSALQDPWSVVTQLLHPSTSQLYTLPQISPVASMLLDRYFSASVSASMQSRNTTMNTLVRLACAHAVLRTAWGLLSSSSAGAQKRLAALVLGATEVYPVDALFAIASVNNSTSRLHGGGGGCSAPSTMESFVYEVRNRVPEYCAASAEHGETLDETDDRLQAWFRNFVDDVLTA